MSYARFGWDGSNVYLYDDAYDGLRCCACPFLENWASFATGYDYDAMLAHIAEHRAAGHHVPAEVDDELIADRDAALSGAGAAVRRSASQPGGRKDTTNEERP